MKGFKFLLLLTMLFAVTSLFATVHKPESVKSPPGYSICEMAQTPFLNVQSFEVACFKNEEARYERSLSQKEVSIKQEVDRKVQIELKVHRPETFNSYSSTVLDNISNPVADALPDKTAINV